MNSDNRRTLTPDGSVITIGAVGFSLDCQGSNILDLRWDKIRQILAYTRFLNGMPQLCLYFVFSRRNSDVLVVHHKVQGWNELVA